MNSAEGGNTRNSTVTNSGRDHENFDEDNNSKIRHSMPLELLEDVLKAVKTWPFEVYSSKTTRYFYEYAFELVPSSFFVFNCVEESFSRRFRMEQRRTYLISKIENLQPNLQRLSAEQLAVLSDAELEELVAELGKKIAADRKIAEQSEKKIAADRKIAEQSEKKIAADRKIAAISELASRRIIWDDELKQTVAEVAAEQADCYPDERYNLKEIYDLFDVDYPQEQSDPLIKESVFLRWANSVICGDLHDLRQIADVKYLSKFAILILDGPVALSGKNGADEIDAIFHAMVPDDPDDKLFEISINDLLDGQQESLLTMCWQLIQIFWRKFAPTPLKMTEALERWCAEATASHPDIIINDFTSSFRDGFAINILIKLFNDTLVDLNQISELHAEDRIENALGLAHRHFRVPKLIQPNEFCSENIDMESVSCYLMMLYLGIWDKLWMCKSSTLPQKIPSALRRSTFATTTAGGGSSSTTSKQSTAATMASTSNIPQQGDSTSSGAGPSTSAEMTGRGTKRKRTFISDENRQILASFFTKTTKNPSLDQYVHLALTTGLEISVVRPVFERMRHQMKTKEEKQDSGQ